jgi:hypothetical protein
VKCYIDNFVRLQSFIQNISKDLVKLAFVGLTPVMWDKMDGQDFTDVNQLLKWAVMHESRAEEAKNHGRFRETASKEKPSINYMEEDSTNGDDDSGVCVAEWVIEEPGKQLACAFLKPSPGKKDEIKFMFDMTKCDKLFDVLLQNKVIQLNKGHVVPHIGQAVKGKYCK